MSGTERSQDTQGLSGYDKDNDVVVYRTDVLNDEKWAELKELVMKNEYPPQYFYVDAAGVATEDLPLVTDNMTFIVLADEVTMNDNTFLVIDRESGNKLRVQAEYLADITNNLSLANMGFDEFEESAIDGVFRGFQDPE